jgi:hypothetical protein
MRDISTRGRPSAELRLASTDFLEQEGHKKDGGQHDRDQEAEAELGALKGKD